MKISLRHNTFHSMESKKSLRKYILDISQSFIDNNKSQQLCKKLINTDEWKSAKNIMIYSPLHGEVNVLHLMKMSKKNYYFPKVSKNNLRVMNVKKLEDLEKGTFNIKEPKETCIEIDICKLDLIIVPGLAFTKDGKRLGRGKGYYDRVLKKAKDIKTISLIFKFQLIKNFKQNRYDELVKKVIY